MTKPLGISEFNHLEQLPEQLEGSLPTIEALEAELASPETPSAVKPRRAVPNQMARDDFELGPYDDADTTEGSDDKL